MERTNSDNLGYFGTYPAPMWEGMMAKHPGDKLNATTPYYGPLLYWLCWCAQGGNVLELGVSFGWTGGFLANAVKDINTRHGTANKYVGVDIIDLADVEAKFKAQDLPATLITSDSIEWLESQTLLAPGSVNVAFVDDLHNTDHIVREVELVYPLLQGGGNGYMIHHDTYDLSEMGDKAVREDPRYEWEVVRFFPNYGLTLYRKMEGYDHNKVYRPEGDQEPYEKGKG